MEFYKTIIINERNRNKIEKALDEVQKGVRQEQSIITILSTN